MQHTPRASRVALAIVVAFAATLGSLAVIQAAGPSGIDPQLPPDKAARASAAASFMAAAAQGHTAISKSAVALRTATELGLDISTPAGDGRLSPDDLLLTPVGYSGSIDMTNTWTKGAASGAHMTVWAGVSGNDNQQGLLVVGVFGSNAQPTSWQTVQVPNSGGHLRISGATGSLLTVTSANGRTFTFDPATGSLK